jgi:hypothetical protein
VIDTHLREGRSEHAAERRREESVRLDAREGSAECAAPRESMTPDGGVSVCSRTSMTPDGVSQQCTSCALSLCAVYVSMQRVTPDGVRRSALVCSTTLRSVSQSMTPDGVRHGSLACTLTLRSVCQRAEGDARRCPSTVHLVCSTTLRSGVCLRVPTDVNELSGIDIVGLTS